MYSLLLLVAFLARRPS